jgi:hypothetical protein
MVYRFDVVAIGIEDIRGVVVLMVMGSKPRSAMIRTTSRDSVGVKGVDFTTARRRKGG